MRSYRLSLDDLNVDSFEPVAEPVDPAQPLMVDWTGCMSDCSGCGMYCGNVIGGGY